MNHLHFPPFTVEFKNLTPNKIAFISKKVYQRNTRAIGDGKDDQLPALTESADFIREPDSNFEPLEPREERKLINWSIHTNNQLSDDVANIVFRIRYLEHEYTFNFFLAYRK